MCLLFLTKIYILSISLSLIAKVIRNIPCNPYVRDLKIDPEGKYVSAYMAEGLVCIWDIEYGK